MCSRPLIRKMRDSYGRATVMTIPCGKCAICLADRQNSWKLRLLEESSNWKNLYFFTLTYADEAIPMTDDGRTQVDKRDIQGWLKRFRTRFSRFAGYDAPFKYFIASEYAPDGMYVDRHGIYRRSTVRPHYHGVIFSDIPESIIRGTLFHDWRMHFGFFKLDRISADDRCYSKVANYVSKYCCKGCFASRQEEIRDGLINDTFNLMSKGIGESYVQKKADFHLCGHTPYLPVRADVLDKIVASRFVVDGSYKYKMPRYWKDRIYKLPFYETKLHWDKEKSVFVYKKVKRYSSKAPLSQQIASVLHERFIQRIAQQVAEYTSFQERGVSSDFLASYYSSEEVDLKERRKFLQLQSFYEGSASRNSSLCFSNF